MAAVCARTLAVYRSALPAVVQHAYPSSVLPVAIQGMPFKYACSHSCLFPHFSPARPEPMDLYDNMLDSIQQFPLDANCFERSIKRLNKTYARRMAKYQKILERMPEPGHRPFVVAQRRLEQCLKQKKKIIRKFMQRIKCQLVNLEEYNRMNGSTLQLKRLAPV